MKKTNFLMLAALPLLFTACNTVEPKPVVKDEPFSLEKRLAAAARYEKMGNYRQAFIAYSDVQKDIDDIELFRDVQIHRTHALFKMGKYSAALSALAPMPELPASLYDCKKLFLAARILKKMKSNPEYIEALMEVALDNKIDAPGVIVFKADGYAELGRFYVYRKKIDSAIKCFKYASDLYKMDHNTKKADACRNILEYLR